MKYEFLLVVVLLLLACNDKTNPGAENSKVKADISQKEGTLNKPKVSFTFDDGITNDIVGYKFEDWNEMILTALRKANLKSIFFVTGSNKKDSKGKYLLDTWNNAGHKIANHTYTHPNFNSEKISLDFFEFELQETEKVISEYTNYIKLFRFPYLKEGNTSDKIKGFRDVLDQNGYSNGHVTIDASDWYINGELIKSIRKDGISNPKVEKYKEFYLQHILERANFYEKLSYELTNRNINHTLLLHHNLTSALFLDDLIERFIEEGWNVINAELAYEDEIFKRIPSLVRAGESIIWALAKETGKYEAKLRYPAEDSRYEIPKMKEMGL